MLWLTPQLFVRFCGRLQLLKNRSEMIEKHSKKRLKHFKCVQINLTSFRTNFKDVKKRSNGLRLHIGEVFKKSETSKITFRNDRKAI
jgi:hypothetical protein